MALSREEFGRRFRAARERAHLTQEGVADQLGVKWRQVQRWDTGQVLPRAERIPELAKILGVEPSYLQEPVDEHVVDRTARLAQENAVALRTALALLDELLSEVRENRSTLHGLIHDRSEAISSRMDALEQRQDVQAAELNQVQAEFLQALGVDAPRPATGAGERATTRESTSNQGTRPADGR